jgi:outer membrane receptor protein involved in Fe transport
VDKNIVSSGGTALDVMKNVPSVQVDIDGNVKLRNAAPQIYVDGRPTTLSLDQIPADAIQSVEVITNPSAKYDASGGNAGILNIVLKKNKKTGYNGNLMAGVDSHGGLNGGGNFSVRQGKLSLNAAVMANQRHDRTNGTTDRLDFGDTLTHIYQENTSKTNGAFIFGRLGLDYFVTNRTTLSLSGIRVHGEFKPTDVFNKTTTSVFDSGQINSLSAGNSNNSRIFNAHGLQFGMVHNFAKKDEQLTADANYFSGKNEGTALYTTNYYDANGNYTGDFVQQQLSNGNNQFFTVQTDYTNPLSEKTKLETGLRMQINEIENNNQTYNQAPDGEFTKIPGTANNYTNSNKVYAAYATVTSSIKNFGYEVGLRAESSNYDGELTNTGEKFSNSYPISLFPSVFLSQKLKNRQELQLNFSRRINRPNFFQLIPYTDYSDSLNITRGNPNLVPEFTNSIEFSYSKTYKKNNNLLASIYYKHTNDLITRYQDTAHNAASGKTDLINSYINANSAYSYGAELTSVNYVNKWWDFTLNVNLYKSKINTDNVSQFQQDAMLSWFSKFNNNFKLPANFSIQLSTSYQSKTNLPVSSGGQQFGPPTSQAQAASQGYIKPFWVADIAIKKTFLKNNAAAVTLSMSDIFRSRVNEQIAFNEFFYQDYYRLSNPQLVRLNFTYRFGKMDISLFKRQSKGQGEGAQEATQMGGTR